MRDPDEQAFEEFMRRVEPGLHRALFSVPGIDRGRKATAEALAWAWAWEQLHTEQTMSIAAYASQVGPTPTTDANNATIGTWSDTTGQARSTCRLCRSIR